MAISAEKKHKDAEIPVLRVGGVYRHMRSGGLYTLISLHGAKAFYIAHADGSRWWRPVEEFFDGRFEHRFVTPLDPEELGFKRG